MPSPRRHLNLTVRALRPLVAGFEEVGLDSDALLNAAQIPAHLLSEPDAAVPSSSVGALWRHALLASGDDCLGLHLAEAAPLASFEVHAYALLSSDSLREAYRRASRYQRLIHEATALVLEEGPDSGTLVHSLPGGRPVGRHPAEFLATAWVRIGRLVTGDEWSPEAVFFAHDPPDVVEEHRRVFKAPVHFRSGRTAMRIANATLDRPAKAADETLAGILDRHVSAVLESKPDPDSLADRVRAILSDGLRTGDVSVKSVARRLSMSERSLRRGLAAEGTNHRELFDRVRQERAVALLTQRRCSIAEVAFLLGFSELSAFYRAFKRWTGTTPAEVRADASGRIGQ